jgi:hypothetical protein
MNPREQPSSALNRTRKVAEVPCEQVNLFR